MRNDLRATISLKKKQDIVTEAQISIIIMNPDIMSFKKQRENISMYALFAFNQRHTDNTGNANNFIDSCAV